MLGQQRVERRGVDARRVAVGDGRDADQRLQLGHGPRRHGLTIGAAATRAQTRSATSSSRPLHPGLAVERALVVAHRQHGDAQPAGHLLGGQSLTSSRSTSVSRPDSPHHSAKAGNTVATSPDRSWTTMSTSEAPTQVPLTHQPPAVGDAGPGSHGRCRPPGRRGRPRGCSASGPRAPPRPPMRWRARSAGGARRRPCRRARRGRPGRPTPPVMAAGCSTGRGRPTW